MANEKRLIDANALIETIRFEYDLNYGEILTDPVRFADMVDDAPTMKAVPLDDIYRVIAGHSNYHGDSILSALTCIAEGKEVKPVKPLPTVDSVEVVRCKDCKYYDNSEGIQWCHLNSKFYKGGTDWHSFPEDGFCSYGERRTDERKAD